MTQLVETNEGADYSAGAMTRTLFLGLLTAAFLAAPAAAQTQMYPGQGITVNPAAINGGGYASPYARNPYADVIHLHLPAAPVHHHHVAAKPKPAESDAAAAPAETTPAPAAPTSPPPGNSPYPPPLDSLTDTSTPPAPAPVKHTHHKHAEEAATPPAPTANSTPDTNASGDAAMPLTLDPQNEITPTPPQRHKRADKTASADSGAPATTIVSAPSDSAKSGMTRRSEILFPRGDPDVSASTVDKMRSVAADLNTLLGAGAQRVQLDAYGGAPGDKSSDARRLSLKRALGIRQLLIEDGIPSEKIDVRALGGIDDNGAPDRVDVLVRGG
jgi:outer membrane protein OmpA-like peptidoglycan-associated protein